MVLPSAVGEASDDWLAATRSELAARGAAADSNGKATIANVLFVAGGVAAVTGGVLFLISMPEPGMKTAERAP